MGKAGVVIMAFLMGCSCLVACAAKSNAPQVPETEKRQASVFPVSAKTFVDIQYVEGKEPAQRLDILQPQKHLDGPMPVIVFIHGGGFEGGDKRDGWEYLRPFVENGFLGVSINYRLSHQAVFPAQIEDVKSAIRYLRAHAGQFNLDPMRIGVWGTSAGGHLAALLGTSHGVKEMENGPWQGYSSEVQAVCEWYGPVDFLRHDFRAHVQNSISQLLGGESAQKRDLAKMASPLKYIDKTDPPFLIMHGREDKTIPYMHSVLLANELKRAGVPVRLISLKGADHGDVEVFENAETLQKVFDFFNAVLRKGERL